MSVLAKTDEGRSHPRYNVVHETQVMFLRELPDGCERIFSGRIVDKSPQGFCVETPAYVSKGDLLRVCTDISDESELYFDVRWVCSMNSGYLFGCNFVDLTLPEQTN